MPLIVVENSYDPPLTREQFIKGDPDLHRCMDLRQIRWVRSLLSQDGTRSVCQFEAVDAETVREAFRFSGVTFERIWLADEVLA